MDNLKDEAEAIAMVLKEADKLSAGMLQRHGEVSQVGTLRARILAACETADALSKDVGLGDGAQP